MVAAVPEEQRKTRPQQDKAAADKAAAAEKPATDGEAKPAAEAEAKPAAEAEAKSAAEAKPAADGDAATAPAEKVHRLFFGRQGHWRLQGTAYTCLTPCTQVLQTLPHSPSLTAEHFILPSVQDEAAEQTEAQTPEEEYFTYANVRPLSHAAFSTLPDPPVPTALTSAAAAACRTRAMSWSAGPSR